jgi:hypothetical protein
MQHTPVRFAQAPDGRVQPVVVSSSRISWLGIGTFVVVFIVILAVVVVDWTNVLVVPLALVKNANYTVA